MSRETKERSSEGMRVARWSALKDRVPIHAVVADVDLVIVRYDDKVSVLYGRCLHRGALLADGHIDGVNLICDLHGWDYRYDSGISEYNNAEALQKFSAWVDVAEDAVLVDEREIRAWAEVHPQPYKRNDYLA